jgi:hypothetical protein
LRNNNTISLIQGTIGLEGEIFNFTITSNGNWFARQLKTEYVKSIGNDP